MKIIAFHLKGKMAHFRKNYSNSSALSYFLPPRTTICGIIAGLLGLERDSYYEQFSLDNCKVAVASLAPIKKSMQKMNYLMIKKLNDLNGSQENHAQVAMELIIPQNISTDFIDYKVWLHHKDDKIMDNLIEMFKQYKQYFYKSLGISVSLGAAFNLGWVEFEGIYEGKTLNDDIEKQISSSIVIDNIKELKLEKVENFRLIKEGIPLEFDKNRHITSKGSKDILMNIKEGKIQAIVKSAVELENKEIITWME